MRCLTLLLAAWLPAYTQAPVLNLVVVEGEGQINNIKQRTAREPVVEVQDENHRPVAGAVVVFTLPSNGAGGAFANGAHTLTVTADEQGHAVARGFRPNSVKGQFRIHVNASQNGRTASIEITQTNAVLTASGAVAAGGISAKLIAVLAVAGAAAAGGIAYGVHQAGGGSTPATSAIPPVTIGAGSGTVGPPR
ncbi:MAG TPA: hypothetical protein VMH28_26710 [Candidatus Acidoferrales bacterium]|nr:hypothetical protein [Candidatus Acidoferrales bacterium]